MNLFSKIVTKEQAIKEIRISSIIFCALILLFFPGHMGDDVNAEYSLIGIFIMDILLLAILVLLYYTLKSQIGAVLIALTALYFLSVTLLNFEIHQWQSYYFFSLYLIMTAYSIRGFYATYLLDNRFKE
jgi:hypothetical protein